MVTLCQSRHGIIFQSVLSCSKAILFAMQYLCSRPIEKDSEVTGTMAYKRRIIFAPFTKLSRRRRRAINRRRMEFYMVSYDVLPFPEQEYVPLNPEQGAYPRYTSCWNNNEEECVDDEMHLLARFRLSMTQYM
ncbi:hypothetical protein V1517DRAFT_107095 [Lipomyces orientalis]|uniref:Uncharacterized protein n=1 Tax=Lipomyces orientalis TaxID=1233043 RepID=A0ACC3TPP2_9ASCO